MLVLLPGIAHAHPFDCKHNRCGLLAKGNYGNIVIGTVERVANEQDMRKVYTWARAHGYWRSLAPGMDGYLRSVKVLSLSVVIPDRHSVRSVTVLMTPKEFNTAILKPGDQVRYSPHDAEHERKERPTEPKARAYWDLVGCVAMICGAKDTSCRTRYRSGVYRHDSGREVDPKTGRVLAHGARIDPVSLLPIAGGETEQGASAKKRQQP